MEVTKAVVLVFVLLALLAGCGGGRDRNVEIHIQVSDRATETAVTVPAPLAGLPSPTVAPGQPVAVPTEAPQPTSPPEQAPAVTEEPPTEAPPAPTLPPTAPPPTEAPPPTQPPPAPEEQYTFDPAAWEDSLTTLSSFRQKVVLDFTADSGGAQSRAVYEGEVTTNPTALHSILTVEGQAAAQLPSNRVEVIWIGDQVWVKVGRQPWVRVPTTAIESQYAGQVIGVGELLPFVQQARRVMPDEMVNGIPCKHYVYNVSNLQTEAGMTSAQGDIWVAKDGGYVVRLTMNGHGSYYGTYATSGTLNLVYDLYDVNAPISIQPPR